MTLIRKRRIGHLTAFRNDDDEKQQSNAKNARLHNTSRSSADDEFSSSSAAAATLLSRSPAQRLYSDALLSVFRFLSLTDLISAHASCRAWRDAAHKEPSRQIVLRCASSELSWFFSSPLRHHVGGYPPSDRELSLDQFASRRFFPSLLVVPIHVTRLPFGSSLDTAAAWPSKLTDLRMALVNLTPRQAQEVIDRIGKMGTMAALLLRVGGLLSMGLSLQPLQQLTQLHTLQLRRLKSILASDCAVIKQIGSLTHLSLRRVAMPVEMLRALCTPPHHLSGLRWLELGGTVTAAHMESLLLLPALVTLDLHEMDLDAALYLPRLRLRSFEICDDALSLAFCYLCQCTHITQLVLRSASLLLADLVHLSKSLPLLTSLRFSHIRFAGWSQSTALPFLRHLSQLHDLQFYRCPGIRLVHLVDGALASLSNLRVLDVFLPDEDLLAARALFKLPCKVVPQLTHACIDALGEEKIDPFEDAHVQR